MATQAEIDAAVERFAASKTYGGTKYTSFVQADTDAYMLASAYRALRDPTPITPEGLEAEIKHHGWFQHIETDTWWSQCYQTRINAGAGMRDVYVVHPRGSGYVKTMGQLRLAMLLAGGER